ncbi:MAG: UvrD-helicase domain-containing protein [Gammaproteobacteria bacterium]|nr:UvrD-helicase domain-containing protein [Gammaproteobacteria bacterium]
MSAIPNPLNAANPEHSAVVKASAGVGKTYLLVTRLIRLLLADARPDAILAITFTRKAATEMQTRLAERLFEFVQCDRQTLKAKLRDIGVASDDENCLRARNLYERLMRLENPVKATTFHAFCQDILRRFPMEADVPPAFDLIENEAPFIQAAWEALYAEATLDPDGELGLQLEILFDTFNSLNNTQEALQNFLSHRSDWWAFCSGVSQPVETARQNLLQQLRISPDENPLLTYFSRLAEDELQQFCDLLRKHSNKGNDDSLTYALNALDESRKVEERFNYLWQVFFTQADTPRARKPSKAQDKAMTAAGAAQFLAIHDSFVHSLSVTREQINRHLSYKTCLAWYFAGQRLLDHFQRLKREQRCLDFADLEWKAYELLHHANNATWVQYKLDQRIEHLLIDEFQDTNPTQWQLVLPVLQELASQHDGRSAFIVGDDKQSIYAFRRAEPKLLEESAQWLESHLRAQRYPMDKSRRSATAIMQVVNQCFTPQQGQMLLNDFHQHSTFNEDLWGRVELLPLVEADEKSENATQEFRNPLLQPRIIARDTRYLREGRIIAEKILSFYRDELPIGNSHSARAFQYGDAMILIRARTQADAYEQALREAGIPYNSARHVELLDTQEIKDLTCLLQTLQAPINDLALATVLRSPIFCCSNGDVISIARYPHGNNWYDKLHAMREQGDIPEILDEALIQIDKWRGYASYLPTHDLLDRIFFERNLLQRYAQNVASHTRDQVLHNLHAFTSLALEVDSGRYPSVGRFLARLEELKEEGHLSKEENGSSENRVRIMTIHGSKGLEAPVVFIAGAADTRNAARPYRAIVNWPAESDKPKHFMVVARKKYQDELTQMLLQIEEQRFTQEDMNLLYVALTRARQFLFVSACRPSRSKQLGWYGLLTERLGELASIESGQKPTQLNKTESVGKPVVPVDPALTRPFDASNISKDIRPSQALHDSEYFDEQGRNRGVAIHRFIELLSSHRSMSQPALLAQVSSETGIPVDGNSLVSLLEEAQAVVENAKFSDYFNTDKYDKAYNELPIQFKHGEHWVTGVIDRLIIHGDYITLLDYKTHRITKTALKKTATEYHAQMKLYAEGIARLWPQKEIRCLLLFTHIGEATACQLQEQLAL